MKKPIVLRILPLLCAAVFILTACQKETSTTQEQTNNPYTGTRTSGVVPDDPAKVAKVPALISSEFLKKPDANILSQTNAKGKPVKPGTDAIAPTVSITSPSNGATVSGTVTIQTDAADNMGIASVILTIDDIAIGTKTSAPYDFTWSATEGTHVIKATAKDAAGNTNSNSIIVTTDTPITTLPPADLPSSFSLLMPPVENQGGEGACAVFATTYAARSAEQFYRTKASTYSYSTNIFSPEFVYNQTKVFDCGSGTGITTALDFLVNTGVCTWQSMPYSYSNGCSLMPTAAQVSEAGNYKINSYAKVLSSDVVGIKTMVFSKHPVIVTINPDESFWGATPGFIWKTYSGTPGISHNVVICGYDDAKHAYKVMNSWGTGWGDAGYSWIDYDFFPQASFYYSYVIN